MNIPEYAKAWQFKIPLIPNGKMPIKDFLKVKKVDYTIDYFKKHNGNWGFYTKYSNIAVPDFDCRNDAAKEKLRPIIEEYFDTKIIESKHGFHPYLEIIDDYPKKWTHTKNLGYTRKKFYPCNQTIYPELLSGIDFQVGEALVVGEGSQSKGWTYKAINDKPIKKITRKEWDAIVEKFILKPEAQIPIPKPFQDMAVGDLNPHDIKVVGEKKEEFLLWKYFFMDCYHKCNVRPDHLYEGLKSFIPSFDVDKAKLQLSYHYHAVDGYWIDKKTNKKIPNAPMSKENLMKNFPEYYSNTIKVEKPYILTFQGGTHYGKPKMIELTNTGIQAVIEKTVNKLQCFETIPLWLWDSFSIERILIDKTSGEAKELYDYEYNSDSFKDKSFEQMKQHIAAKSCLNSKDRQIFGQVVHQYCKVLKVPKIECLNVCGFTEKGWTNPPEYHITFNKGIQQKFKANISKLNTIDTESTLEKFQKLYKVIKVKNKDVIFAYGIMAPFFYAMLDHTQLSPFLALHSAKNTTGKSTMAKLITKKTWNNYELLSSNQLNSTSRARDYLSSSSYPIVIDESSKLKEDIIDLLKSMATTISTAEYKNIDQSLGMDKPLCTPIIYTFNSPPPIFTDTSYLSRGYLIEVDTPMTTEDQEKFTKCVECFQDGEIGAFIIKQLNNLTVDELKTLYSECEGIKTNEIRLNTKAKLLQLGALLFKKVFDITLDLSDLPNILAKSNYFGADDIFSILEDQLEEGTAKLSEWYSKDGGHQSEWRFKPQGWIQTEIQTSTYKGESGYVYTTNNLQDLKNRLHIQIAGVRELYEILSKKWIVGEYKVYSVEGRKMSGIFIPETHDKPVPTTLKDIENEYGEEIVNE